MAVIVPVLVLAGVLFYILHFSASNKDPVLAERQGWERNGDGPLFDQYAGRGTSPYGDDNTLRRGEKGRSFAAPSERPSQNNEEGFMRGQGRGRDRSLSPGDGGYSQDQRAGGRGRGQGQGRGRGYDGLYQNRDSDSFRYQDQGVTRPE